MALSMRQELNAISQKVEKSQADNGVEIFSKCFTMQSDFLAFQGHFPDYPILPGIVQIMMAEMTISESMQTEYTIQEVKQGKFVKPIEPNCDVYVKVFLVKENIWDCEIHTDSLAGRFRLLCEINE